MQALEELQDNLTTEDNSKPIDSEKKIPTNPSNKSEDDGEGDINNAPLSEKIYATKINMVSPKTTRWIDFF